MARLGSFTYVIVVVVVVTWCRREHMNYMQMWAVGKMGFLLFSVTTNSERLFPFFHLFES